MLISNCRIRVNITKMWSALLGTLAFQSLYMVGSSLSPIPICQNGATHDYIGDIFGKRGAYGRHSGTSFSAYGARGYKGSLKGFSKANVTRFNEIVERKFAELKAENAELRAAVEAIKRKMIPYLARCFRKNGKISCFKTYLHGQTTNFTRRTNENEQCSKKTQCRCASPPKPIPPVTKPKPLVRPINLPRGMRIIG
uniref:uncharacterized protein LOC120333837 isoform X1 n=1 Tax=Styela clava TaxID=7725 RepID=UPI00193A0FDF|nr:uncharacterized protein LOC120333837 isoform X1 [Styela clava]